MKHLRHLMPVLVLAFVLIAVIGVAQVASGGIGLARVDAGQGAGPAGQEAPALAPSSVVTLTILHTNDFHGRLEPDPWGRGGSAHVAAAIEGIRAAEGAENVVLVDAGDVYFAAPPISQLSLGESTIEIYNVMGYDVAAYGNHEFDKGQSVLISRTLQSDFPWIGANIVLSGTDWTHPWWTRPYVTMTVGTAGSEMTLGIIGLDTDSTPGATIEGVTDGLVFRDLTEAVLHYYDEVKTQADALIVLAHQGTNDFEAHKGLQTVARELADAGKPLDLMIGGHQHEPLQSPVMVSGTAIIEAGSYGHWLGRADVTVDLATQDLELIDYELITITTEISPNLIVSDRVAYWAEQVAPLVQQAVGSTYIDLPRGGQGDWILGNLVTDGMRWKADLTDDGQLNGSVEIAFTNTGGLRADIAIPPDATLPYTITWGDTFNVMPFGDTLYLMDLTGAQLQAFLEAQAQTPDRMMQLSGASFSYYNDCDCSSPAVWGSYGVQVGGQPLDYAATYRIVTNNYSAANGILAEGTNRQDTYVDMQEAVNEYLATISPVEASDIVMGRMSRLDGPQPSLVSSSKAVVDANGDEVAKGGEVLTYTITLNNTGDSAAGLLLTDTLPPGLTYVEGSLRVDFPGVGFVATVAGGMLTAHTDGYLSPPPARALPVDEAARIAYAAQVSQPAPRGEYLSNGVELRDQFAFYTIAPSAIALPPTYRVFLPLLLR